MKDDIGSCIVIADLTWGLEWGVTGDVLNKM